MTLISEAVVNRVFEILPYPTKLLNAQCQWLTGRTDVIAGVSGFHCSVGASQFRISQTWSARELGGVYLGHTVR